MRLLKAALSLIAAGFALILVGLFVSSVGTSSSSFGAVILIGPFPIMLGSGPYGAELVLVAAILTLAALLIFFLASFSRFRTA